MRKWTVRVDDELAARFSAMCDAVGVSKQAALEASVCRMVDHFEADDMAPLAAWLAEARQLDADKRRSGPSEPLS